MRTAYIQCNVTGRSVGLLGISWPVSVLWICSGDPGREAVSTFLLGLEACEQMLFCWVKVLFTMGWDIQADTGPPPLGWMAWVGIGRASGLV